MLVLTIIFLSKLWAEGRSEAGQESGTSCDVSGNCFYIVAIMMTNASPLLRQTFILQTLHLPSQTNLGAQLLFCNFLSDPGEQKKDLAKTNRKKTNKLTKPNLKQVKTPAVLAWHSPASASPTFGTWDLKQTRTPGVYSRVRYQKPNQTASKKL